MPMMRAEASTLLLIDFQAKLMPAMDDAPATVANGPASSPSGTLPTAAQSPGDEQETELTAAFPPALSPVATSCAVPQVPFFSVSTNA